MVAADYIVVVVVFVVAAADYNVVVVIVFDGDDNDGDDDDGDEYNIVVVVVVVIVVVACASFLDLYLDLFSMSFKPWQYPTVIIVRSGIAVCINSKYLVSTKVTVGFAYRSFFIVVPFFFSP